jgi:hypothetical protein
MGMAAGSRVDDHGARAVGRGVAGAVSEELMNIVGVDAVAVVPLVLGVHRQKGACCRVASRKAEQNIGPEARRAAEISADGDSGTVGDGDGAAPELRGNVGGQTPDDGFPEDRHAKQEAVRRVAEIGEEVGDAASAQEQASPGVGSAVAGVEPRVPGAIQRAESGARCRGLWERVGGGTECARDVRVRYQRQGGSQRRTQDTVVPDIRLAVEGADVESVQLSETARELCREVEASAQDGFNALMTYVVAAQPLAQQSPALFQESRGHEIGVTARAGGPVSCCCLEGRRRGEGVGEPGHESLTGYGQLRLDDQADPVQQDDSDCRVGLETPPGGPAVKSQAAARLEGL